jgi:hypothetical protein
VICDLWLPIGSAAVPVERKFNDKNQNQKSKIKNQE